MDDWRRGGGTCGWSGGGGGGGKRTVAVEAVGELQMTWKWWTIGVLVPRNLMVDEQVEVEETADIVVDEPLVVAGRMLEEGNYIRDFAVDSLALLVHS